MTPIISIIIPCFNQGQYIDEAIISVEQVMDKSLYEIIIINDGSTDDYTKKTLQALEEKGYHVINQQNEGLSTARNNGIKASRGKFLLPLDADDKIRGGYIEKGIKILNQYHDVGVVYGDAYHFEQENFVFKPGKFSLKRLLVKNYIYASAIIRKDAWQQAGGYDSALSAMEDWDINISIAEIGWKFHYIPELVFDYRIRKNSMIRAYSESKSTQAEDYIAKKHGILYKKEFLKTITITDRIKSSLYDLFKKITGNPNY